MKLDEALEIIKEDRSRVAKRMGWTSFQYVTAELKYVDGDVAQDFYALGSESTSDDWYTDFRRAFLWDEEVIHTGTVSTKELTIS